MKEVTQGKMHPRRSLIKCIILLRLLGTSITTSLLSYAMRAINLLCTRKKKVLFCPSIAANFRSFLPCTVVAHLSIIIPESFRAAALARPSDCWGIGGSSRLPLRPWSSGCSKMPMGSSEMGIMMAAVSTHFSISP